MRIRNCLLAVIAGASVLAACDPSPPPPTNPPPQSWKLTFSDEFQGSSLDTSKWTPEHSTYGDGGGSIHCNTPDNVSVADGALVIEGRKEQVRCPNNGGIDRDYSTGMEVVALEIPEVGVVVVDVGHRRFRARPQQGLGVVRRQVAHRGAPRSAPDDRYRNWFHVWTPLRRDHVDQRQLTTCGDVAEPRLAEGTSANDPTSAQTSVPSPLRSRWMASERAR